VKLISPTGTLELTTTATSPLEESAAGGASNVSASRSTTEQQHREKTVDWRTIQT
jgi:hypothetical protein